MKKWETESEIYTALQRLTEEVRNLRQELEHFVHGPNATERGGGVGIVPSQPIEEERRLRLLTPERRTKSN